MRAGEGVMRCREDEPSRSIEIQVITADRLYGDLEWISSARERMRVQGKWGMGDRGGIYDDETGAG